MIYTSKYPKLSLNAVICLLLFTCFNENSIVLLLCIFETTVIKHISQGATSARVMILSTDLYQGMNIFIGVFMHI